MRHARRLAATIAVATVALIAACSFPKPADTEGEDDETQGASSAPESTHAVRGPDGTTNWIVVRCSSSPECYRRASITCPAGWSIYDKDKSTTYEVSGRSWSQTTGQIHGTGTTQPTVGGGSRSDFNATGDSTTVGIHRETVLPIENGEMLVKCGSSEQNDAKLFDQLKALCDDGNAKACAALDFATKKRGCCSWHQGARSCSEDHRVVCFDGVVSAGPSCDC